MKYFISEINFRSGWRNTIWGVIVSYLFIQPGIALEQAESSRIDATKMIVRYRDPQDQHSFQLYKFELVHRAMELTREEFGDYENIPYRGPESGQQRWANLISEGKLMNLAWVSPGTRVANADVIPIPIDIMRGYLGFRVCLINSKAPPDFNPVLKTGALSSLKIGQGNSWDDVDVYRYNKIEPILGPNFSSLFDMLGFNRFDCLALGIDEILLIQEEKKPRYPFLMVEDKLLIYYEFPIYLYVSKVHPLLAKRLLVGLTKMQQSGGIDKLFKEYHSFDLAPLHLESRKAICLKSPFKDLATQCVSPPVLPRPAGK